MESLMDYIRAPKPGSDKMSGSDYTYAYQPYRRGCSIADDARTALKGRAKRRLGRDSMPMGRLIVLDRKLDEAIYLEEIEHKGWKPVTERQAIEAFGSHGVKAAHAMTPVTIELDPPWKSAAARLMPADAEKKSGPRMGAMSREAVVTQEDIDHRQRPRRRRRGRRK